MRFRIHVGRNKRSALRRMKSDALSRDNGISRDFLMSRLAGDLLVIRSFPPESRWFARNEDDEALLTGAAARVFDAPQSPQWRLVSIDNGKSPAQLKSAMR
jgi:hypothetical protein